MISETSADDSLERTATRADRAHAAAADVAARGSSYLRALVAGVLLSSIAFYAVLLLLQRSGNLPPPAFANSLCLDEKLAYLRDHPVEAPDLLVVGSSVAWRHFDGAAVADKGIKPLNGGFCGLHVNQSVFMTHWLLDRNPSVRQVLLIAAPQDFTLCHARRTEVVNRQDADDFVFGGASLWPYYLRYFSPTSLVGNARRVKERRTNPAAIDALVFDRFADGPLDTSLSRDTLYYGAPDPLDPGCFEALRSLAARLAAEGRVFKVVSTPLHPDWKAQVDPQRRFLDEFDRRMADTLRPYRAQYWSADKEWKPPRSAFTDAIHLRWSAAGGFTAAMTEKLALHLLPVAR